MKIKPKENGTDYTLYKSILILYKNEEKGILKTGIQIRPNDIQTQLEIKIRSK